MDYSPTATATNSGSGEASVSSSGQQPPDKPLAVVTKRKRNLPGMPDPDAEVIALSPNSLTATNRFVCEICSKGFQRDQNLQLHRRGHNLPWKLRQRTGTEPKKRVYVCPEPGCIHHDPSRALGDLTGIKKHYFRKHGEKKWKCDKCSKKYAVQSDWKAHSKTCGTREYKCDCGTMFSRRDSFITHRAFCNVLAQENAVTEREEPENDDPPEKVVSPSVESREVSSAADDKEEEKVEQGKLQEVGMIVTQTPILPAMPESSPPRQLVSAADSTVTTSRTTSLFTTIFAPVTNQSTASPTPFTDLITSFSQTAPRLTKEPISFFSSHPFPPQQPPPPPPPSAPHMSATALLQKAAQVGATSTTGSLLRGLSFGLGLSSSTSPQTHHHPHQKSDREDQIQLGLSPLLGLGLSSSSSNNTTTSEKMMMGPQALFGPTPTTVDFLGLGMGHGGSASGGGGLPALINSINGGGFDVGPPPASQFGSGKSARNV